MEDGEELFAEGETHRLKMHPALAIDCYKAAEAAGYDAARCKAARWTCHMLQGQWEQAWFESDEIEESGVPDPHRCWNGADWTGKDVLIRCLHGLGDTLQFIRYAPLIREKAKRVTIASQPKLKKLLQDALLADEVITWGEPEPPWQVQMEVNELPRIFRTREDTIPASVPYIQAQRPQSSLVKSCFRVGLVWSASDFDTSRNIPLHLLAPILDLPQVKFCSLQAGEGWTGKLPESMLSLSGKETPIERIAEEMMDLDLVLTVDTMNAHLAGALGRPTWTMLPFQCDWRWMKDREDTPWYPTMRLFRQLSPNNWEVVVEKVRAAMLVTLQQRTWSRRAG